MNSSKGRGNTTGPKDSTLERGLRREKTQPGSTKTNKNNLEVVAAEREQ